MSGPQYCIEVVRDQWMTPLSRFLLQMTIRLFDEKPILEKQMHRFFRGFTTVHLIRNILGPFCGQFNFITTSLLIPILEMYKTLLEGILSIQR